MEEDFILPEGEKAVPSNKTFLLATVTLLTTLIVLSLGVIALLLLDRQDRLVVILVTPTFVPTEKQDITVTATITTTITRTATLALTSTATTTGRKGGHNIVIYANSTPSNKLAITPTASGAWQIVPYPDPTETRSINITPNSGES